MKTGKDMEGDTYKIIHEHSLTFLKVAMRTMVFDTDGTIKLAAELLESAGEVELAKMVAEKAKRSSEQTVTAMRGASTGA